MTPRTPLVNAPLAAFVVAASLALTTPSALAQGGPPPDKGGGGHTETATTNLSYPAVFTGTAPTLNGTENASKLTGLFGETWSYGCAIPAEEFPNTSCVNTDLTFMTYDQCAAICKNAEGGQVAVERMYWQKEGTAVQWQAGSLATTESGRFEWPATHLDWGDNLESQTWSTTSVIRVETTPFTTLPLDENGLPVYANQIGFQMWHVSGKGPDEMWGVRATDEDAPRPFTYESPYAIIHAPNAHLSLTKLAAGGAVCPTTFAPSPFASLLWDGQLEVWYSTLPDGGRAETCTYKDLPYTVELNIGGKFVHGYNWQMSRVPAAPCLGYVKEGWWRLTYHGVDGAVDFATFITDPLDYLTYIKPPVVPDVPEPTALLAGPQLAGPLFAGPRFMLQAAEAEEEADTGTLYRPVVDTVSNITYIDICLNPGRGGGGRR